jgi:hypothetical protein
VSMSTLSPKGEALVRAGRRAYLPTDADRGRLLGQLRAQLGDAALPADLSMVSSGAAAGSTWPLIAAIVAGVGILGGAVFYAWPRNAGPERPQQTQVAPVAETPSPIEPAVAPAAEPAAAWVATPPSVRASAPQSTSGGNTTGNPTDRLAAEVKLLSQATRELRAGRPAGAMKFLDEYRRRFPKGLLRDEYRAASAQALCGLGKFAEANATLDDLPSDAPLVVRAREFCAGKSRSGPH